MKHECRGQRRSVMTDQGLSEGPRTKVYNTVNSTTDAVSQSWLHGIKQAIVQSMIAYLHRMLQPNTQGMHSYDSM